MNPERTGHAAATEPEPAPLRTTDERYAELRLILDEVYHHCAHDKGAERHDPARQLWSDQQIIQLNKWIGTEHGCLFQAAKKTIESAGLPYAQARRELIGAIGYIAGALKLLDELHPTDAALRREYQKPAAAHSSDAALIRALAESHATNDKLAAELGKVRTQLEAYRTWITLDPEDKAVIVVAHCDDQEGSWRAVVRDRDTADKFVAWAGGGYSRGYEFMEDLSVLEGTVSAAELKLWNSTDPAPAHPTMAPTSEQLHNDIDGDAQ